MSTAKTKEIPAKSTPNGVEKKQIQKGAESKATQTMEQLLNPTAEGRIKRAKQFSILSDKHDFLKKKKEELTNFVMSSDGTKEKIVLENAEGYKFVVSNTQTKEKVVSVISEQLSVFLGKSEKEILEFTV